jgi:hypothetical protein
VCVHVYKYTYILSRYKHHGPGFTYHVFSVSLLPPHAPPDASMPVFKRACVFRFYREIVEFFHMYVIQDTFVQLFISILFFYFMYFWEAACLLNMQVCMKYENACSNSLTFSYVFYICFCEDFLFCYNSDVSPFNISAVILYESFCLSFSLAFTFACLLLLTLDLDFESLLSTSRYLRYCFLHP